MPYKFNMLRDTLNGNLGGNSDEEAEKQQIREDVVASGDPIAIKRQAEKDKWERLNDPEYQKKSFLEKIFASGEQTTAEKADMANTIGMVGSVAGSMKNIPSAGMGSGLRSFGAKGVPSTAGRTAQEAIDFAAEKLKQPGLARDINQAAMQSSVPKMLPRTAATSIPEDMSLVDRIKFAKLMSNIKVKP